MDKAQLFALLASQAPKLLALMQNSDATEMLPNLTSALDNGYDPGLIEESLNDTEFPMNVDFRYDTSVNTIKPDEWYGRTLYEPGSATKGLLNFEVQGQGNPSFGPASLTNPESDNALLAFSGPGFSESSREVTNMGDLYKRLQNQDKIAMLLGRK